MENNTSIKIIDNFLNQEDFCAIQSNILGHYFPWYYNDGVVNNNDEDLNNYQFTHCFYSNFLPNSDFFNLMLPIINSIKPNSLIRIKANLLTKTKNHIEHGFHIDIPYLKEEYNSKTAILYMNTNNGYTKFEDRTKVNSIENRLVIFDSRLKHTGSTCTDQKKRVVINFNYF